MNSIAYDVAKGVAHLHENVNNNSDDDDVM
jgi:hypothetical protein